MAGITQKELKKPYFHCGPFTIRKVIVKNKDLKKQKQKLNRYLLMSRWRGLINKCSLSFPFRK